jgi:FkbM family methyltransferase
MLQALKDFATSQGIDVWARPAWRWLTRQKPDPYDEQVAAIIARMLPPDATVVDIGCHKGLVLDWLLKACPNGRFYAFEPLPDLHRLLTRKYANRPSIHLSNIALSSSRGCARFYVDVDAPARSGFHSRGADSQAKRLQSIKVPTDTLDAVLDGVRPHFIKIDVEGAEFRVLQGGQNLIRQSRPIIVFEHGIGGADFYGNSPEETFDLLNGLGLQLSLMTDFLAGAPVLSRQSFCDQFYSHINYYFVAHPPPR